MSRLVGESNVRAMSEQFHEMSHEDLILSFFYITLQSIDGYVGIGVSSVMLDY